MPGFFWVTKKVQGFYWVLYFSSAQISNNITQFTAGVGFFGSVTNIGIFWVENSEVGNYLGIKYEPLSDPLPLPDH